METNQNFNKQRMPVMDFYKHSIDFKASWINNGADQSMIVASEEAGKYMAPLFEGDKQALSKSQIRSVYGEVKRIQGKGFSVERSAFLLLKPKVAYAAGRNKSLGLSLFKEIFDAAYKEVLDEKTFKNFCNLLEAILAYHKAYGGRD
jgi:CRISPR-associated protein Csm2